MPFDPILGAGNQPRSTQTPVITQLSDASLDLASGASPASNTSSVTIPGNTRIYALSVTVNSPVRDQTCTNGVLAITIDGRLVVKYLTPTSVVASESSTWVINEIIPYSYDVYNGAILSATLSADNGGTTGYILQVNINSIGVEF